VIPALLVAAFISGALTIGADSRGRFGLVYIFKPLTMAAVIAIAVILFIPERPLYGRWILAGLLTSLVGDVALMLKKKRFIAGLVCFLIAHLYYGAAFASGVPFRPSFGILVPLAAFAAAVYLVLRPRLGAMQGPVAAYILVIAAMVALAANRYIQAGGGKALSALAGAWLFLISDTSLAVNRFIRKRRLGQLLTLGTYFAAQALIALSI
ncbi:MAG: lysoplasmalogenase, partial [Candidatus Aminicenantes bacterium]|nr:lysoplasmalogenase [Candidatus Aminicenantes bacterium]